jgi:hypothetical protein
MKILSIKNQIYMLNMKLSNKITKTAKNLETFLGQNRHFKAKKDVLIKNFTSSSISG